MGPSAGSRTTEPYRHALDRLRRDLAPTLAALDLGAADPDELDELADELPALQYALHTAAERSLGLARVLGHEPAHAELELALALAREETADVAETLELAGSVAAAALVWEWRVSLFAVRLALRELERLGPEPEPALPTRGALPLVLLAAGVTAVLGGALASFWPVWALGLVLVAVSAGGSQRRP